MQVLKCNVFNIAKCSVPISLAWLDFFSTKTLISPDKNISSLFEFGPLFSESDRWRIGENFTVLNDFVSEEEEKNLIDEIEPCLRKLRYQYDHWDNAIHGFRETERLKWNEANSIILNRLKTLAFGHVDTLPHVHILDLADNGLIKAHVDSTRFCGDVIAGLSLLTDSVMRFIKADYQKLWFSVLLQRRSLYIMKGAVRHEFTHEILPGEKSFFRGKAIARKRRISVICRSVPDNATQ